jgi:hypothetical protein
MKLIIAKNPIVVDYLEGHLLPGTDYEPEAFAAQLRLWMKEMPDNVFVATAFEEETLMGFLIAVAPPGQQHVFVEQAWLDPKVPPHTIQDQAFVRLVLWALDKGLGQIRAETRRETAPFFRRWGFHKFSEIIAYDVNEQLERAILKGASNGSEQQSQDENQSDRQSADGGESAHRPADGGDAVREPVSEVPPSSAGGSAELPDQPGPDGEPLPAGGGEPDDADVG